MQKSTVVYALEENIQTKMTCQQYENLRFFLVKYVFPEKTEYHGKRKANVCRAPDNINSFVSVEAGIRIAQMTLKTVNLSYETNQYSTFQW